MKITRELLEEKDWKEIDWVEAECWEKQVNQFCLNLHIFDSDTWSLLVFGDKYVLVGKYYSKRRDYEQIDDFLRILEDKPSPPWINNLRISRRRNYKQGWGKRGDEYIKTFTVGGASFYAVLHYSGSNINNRDWTVTVWKDSIVMSVTGVAIYGQIDRLIKLLCS